MARAFKNLQPHMAQINEMLARNISCRQIAKKIPDIKLSTLTAYKREVFDAFKPKAQARIAEMIADPDAEEHGQGIDSGDPDAVAERLAEIHEEKIKQTVDLYTALQNAMNANNAMVVRAWHNAPFQYKGEDKTLHPIQQSEIISKASAALVQVGKLIREIEEEDPATKLAAALAPLWSSDDDDDSAPDQGGDEDADEAITGPQEPSEADGDPEEGS